MRPALYNQEVGPDLHRRSSRAIIAICAVLAAPAIAQNDRNAAEHYREAFEQLEGLSDQDYDLISTYAASGGEISADVRAAFDRARPILRTLRDATGIEAIDWGIDYSKGPATLLPHLGPMRQASRLLLADSRARLAHGDARGAAQAAAASLRMSEHAINDPVIINSLVGVAMFRQTHNLLRESIDGGQLNMAGARDLLGAARGLAGDDPFGLVASLEGERAAFSGWLIENFMEEGGRDRLLESMGGLLGVDADDPMARALSQMTQQEFEADIIAYDAAQQRMIAAAKMGDLEAVRREMARLEEDVERGAYGPLTQVFMPAMTKMLESMIDSYVKLGVLIEDLETVAASPEGAFAARNAAIWYRRAIALAAAVDPGQADAVIAIAEQRPGNVGAELGGAFVSIEPVVEQLLIAASIDRCNFDPDDRWRHAGMLADLSHVEGMSKCAELLAGDAWRHLASGDNDLRRRGAAEVAALFRMAEHLGTDGRLVSTRAAAEIADDAADLLQAANAHDFVFDRESATVVREAARRVSTGDPFGYAAALRTYRAVTTEWMLSWFVADTFRRELFVDRTSSIWGEFGADIQQALDSLSDEEMSATLRSLDSLITRAVDDRDSSDFEVLVTEFAARHPRVFADWLLTPVERTSSRRANVLDRLRTLRVPVQAD